MADVDVYTEWLLPKQYEVISQPKYTTTLFIGGVGYGKTRTLAQFVAKECLSYENNQVIVAGATLPAMKLSTIPKVIEYFDEIGLWYNYIEWQSIVKFDNGSWFKFQSLDVSDKELEGSEIGALAVDEISSCPMTRVKSLRNRCRRFKTSRRQLFCGNPPEYGSWLEGAFIPKEGVKPWGKVVTASTYENKLLPADYIEQLEATHIPGSNGHKRMMLGMFGIPAEGAVYSNFNPAVSLIDQDQIEWDKVAGFITAIDLGHSDPFVALYAAVMDNNDIVIFDEYYSTTPKLLSAHAVAIRARYRGGIFVCDYGAQQRMELAALGIRTQTVNKDILMGIHSVRARMSNGTIKIVRGRCPNLLHELPAYVWEGGDKIKAISGDHALDAMRYIVARLDLPRERKK